MKNNEIRYRGERMKYLWALFSLAITAFLLCTALSMIFGGKSIRYHRDGIMCAVLVGIVPFYMTIKGFCLAYKKHMCLKHGKPLDGRIKGKTYMGVRDPYYILHISTNGGEVTTPPISLSESDRIRLKKCTVYRYKSLCYISIERCGSGEKGVSISPKGQADL